MNVRRSAAVLAAVTVIGTAVPAVAATASPTPSVVIPDGLYGTADPTYDGVWRQSLALLAQQTAGVVPADRSVAWLAGQQCANGAFAAYRSDPAKPCDGKLMVDTNSTAAAVQALAALGGHDAGTDKAVTWLKSVQNKDGGWGYMPGGTSDANSTAVVIGALVAAGEQPEQVVKDGKSPYDTLLTFALPCKGTSAGAFAYQPDRSGKLVANADATAAAVVGTLGRTLKGTLAQPTAAPAPCLQATTPEQAARNGASYLATALSKDRHLISALPGAKNQPDYGNTADAALALATAGLHEEADATLDWLEANATQWAAQSGPAAYAQLILTSLATGADARNFGGQDLVKLLNATGPAPKETSPHPAEATDSPDEEDEESGSTGRVVSITLLVLVMIAVAGATLVARARKRRP